MHLVHSHNFDNIRNAGFVSPFTFWQLTLLAVDTAGAVHNS